MKQIRPYLVLTFIVLIGIVIISCGGDEPDQATDTVESVEVTRVVTETVTEEVEEVIEEAGEEVMEEEMEEPAEEEVMEEEVIEEFEEATEEDVSAIDSEGAIGDIPPTPVNGPKVEETRTSNAVAQTDGTSPDVRAPSDEQESTVAVSVAESSQLVAGEIDDNVAFADYLAYLDAYDGPTVIPIDVAERYRILVTGADDQPLLGAKIDVLADGLPMTQLSTHSDGSALLFPGAFVETAVSFTLTITHNNQTIIQEITPINSPAEWHIEHPSQNSDAPVALDILFLIDATGSMADEINQLKENIRIISAQANDLPSAPDVQFGLIAYRDRGDDVALSLTPFTNDIDQFADALGVVEASGGGDYPEDLNLALNEALFSLNWRTNNRVGLIFLVSDAPPHLDYEQDLNYANSLAVANAAGIKIFPIASSGLDEQGAFIFRQLAQVTNGRFIFITDDEQSDLDASSSSGGASTAGYTTANLDDLIISIIRQEIGR